MGDYNDSFSNSRINKLIDLMNNSPYLDSKKVTYRFINDDSYLINLRENDIYETDSFISTTRNPFYDKEIDINGLILLKINIPKNTNGFLLIEPYSFFPEEQELVIGPFNKMKLISINNRSVYNHNNKNITDKINKIYEFVLLE